MENKDENYSINISNSSTSCGVDESRRSTSCIKDRLNANGFHWESGIILVKQIDGKDSAAGDYARENQTVSYRSVPQNDPIISEVTAENYGWGMSGFHYDVVAYDNDKIYYMWEYDGSSGMTSLHRNPLDLLNHTFQGR